VEFDLDAEMAKVLALIERHELADSTFSEYSNRWAEFELWCAANELTSMPAAPYTVQLYFVQYTAATLDDDGVVRLVRRASSLDPHLGAIRWAHRKAGHPTPTSDRSVKALMGTLRTAHQPAAKKARPLRIEDMERIYANPEARNYPSFERAWTAITFGFFGCFRGGEVMATRVENLTFTAAGVLVFVPRSKGDQFGQGEWVGIARRDGDICPVRQLEAWVSALPEGTEWLFPSTRKLGSHLTLKWLSNDIAGVCGYAFDDVSGFSTHSLRRGFCTSAAEAGKSLLSISLKARHKSVTTSLGYIDSTPGEAVQALAEEL
jgi:integrase